MKDFIRSVMAVAFLMLMAGIAFGGYTFYDAYQAKRIFAPAPPPTAHEIQIAAFDAWVWFGVKASMQVAIVLGVYWAALRFLWVPTVKAREEIHYNPDTGMLPVVRRNVAPVWKRMIGHNEYDEFDGNLSVAPHRKVYSNGHMSVTADHDGIDPIAQAEYARGTWGVQGSIARKGRGMTVGEGRYLSGEFHEKAQLHKERALQARDRREMAMQKSLPVVDLVLPVMSDITLSEAVEQSTERAWVIGQATDAQPVPGFKEVGKPLTFDPRTSHVAIIGGTGSGKTASTGLLMALYARQFGIHPILLDGKEGIDWGPLDGVVEWHSMTADTIEWQINAVMSVFQERWNYLKSNGISTIYKIPANNRPVPILLMMEEFGDVWAELRNADKTLYKEMGQKIDKLFRLARATGITLCLIDQSPEKWSQQMRGNAKFVVCYKLKGGVANAFNEYHVDKLPNVGVFSQDNVFYRPWHTEAEIELTRLFPPLERRLIRDRSKRLETVSETAGNGRSPVVETMETAKAMRGDNSKKEDIPPHLIETFRRFRRWDEFCEGYFQEYPNATQAQLRRAMSSLDGREPDTFKTEAFRYYHRLSPNGNPQMAERT